MALIVALAALALGLTACGKKSTSATGQAQPFSLMLDFYPNPDHAGIYMAQKLGYFREAGLDVSITPPRIPRHRSRRSPPAKPTWRSPMSRR